MHQGESSSATRPLPLKSLTNSPPQDTYAKAGLRNVVVVELRFSDSDLNTKRMLDLMAVSGSRPLYIHVVERILRELRIDQQSSGAPFNYPLFKAMLASEDLAPTQQGPLNQRLEMLESFSMPFQGFLVAFLGWFGRAKTSVSSTLASFQS